MRTWQDMSRAERLATVSEMNAGGKTASQIGDALRTTKNAVISIANKAGVRLTDWTTRTSRDTSKAVEARRRAAAERREQREAERRRADEERIAAFEAEQAARELARARPVWAALPGSTPVELWETAPTMSRPGHLCSWPLWAGDDEPKLFCGQPVAGNSYCGSHMRVAYNPPRRKERKHEAVR